MSRKKKLQGAGASSHGPTTAVVISTGNEVRRDKVTKEGTVISVATPVKHGNTMVDMLVKLKSGKIDHLLIYAIEQDGSVIGHLNHARAGDKVTYVWENVSSGDPCNRGKRWELMDFTVNEERLKGEDAAFLDE